MVLMSLGWARRARALEQSSPPQPCASLQDIQEQTAPRPSLPEIRAVLTLAAIRVSQPPSDFQKAPLVGVPGDLAPEKPGLESTTNLTRREATVRDTTQRAISFRVPHSDCFSIRPQDPIA